MYIKLLTNVKKLCTITIMNETNFINKILKEHSIKKAHFAKGIGATRQQVSNWFSSGSVPKDYLIPVSVFLSNTTKKQITVEDILSPFNSNNSERFGAIKILREKHNDNTEV